MAHNSGNSMLAALAGIAIGLGVGVLMAPDEGKKTRKKIKRTFDETTEDIKSRLNELTDEVKAKTMQAKGSLEDNVEYLVTKSSYKADEVIDVLEKKLADLKQANAKLQK
ncbi:gas vesicle protein [Balneicella halophila]|uniref:Gas vesicle protein n=1 Tax=Balneicella halophila TaxID=1537566 RepID=A0A7L4US97_BALHA|nr:YtxH domain-containing protein [Balneicella halophila]PVX52539.1 gas vesicle protein [Balneicella halophila]